MGRIKEEEWEVIEATRRAGAGAWKAGSTSRLFCNYVTSDVGAAIRKVDACSRF